MTAALFVFPKPLREDDSDKASDGEEPENGRAEEALDRVGTIEAPSVEGASETELVDAGEDEESLVGGLVTTHVINGGHEGIG